MEEAHFTTQRQVAPEEGVLEVMESFVCFKNTMHLVFQVSKLIIECNHKELNTIATTHTCIHCTYFCLLQMLLI